MSHGQRALPDSGLLQARGDKTHLSVMGLVDQNYSTSAELSRHQMLHKRQSQMNVESPHLLQSPTQKRASLETITVHFDKNSNIVGYSQKQQKALKGQATSNLSLAQKRGVVTNDFRSSNPHQDQTLDMIQKQK